MSIQEWFTILLATLMDSWRNQLWARFGIGCFRGTLWGYYFGCGYLRHGGGILAVLAYSISGCDALCFSWPP